MRRRLMLLALALAAIAPLGAQQASTPVHVLLRLAGDRTTFKSGEPIRLELVLTADRAGYVVDMLGLDEASDNMTVTPAGGTFRLAKYGWRDVLTETKLSDAPTVLNLTANYWLRFDETGDYTLSVQTHRISERSEERTSASRRIVTAVSNPVTIHVDLPTDSEEQRLVDDAVAGVENAVGSGQDEQIRAVERLAFLAGDAAAAAKYRHYDWVCSRLRNGCDVLRRGFSMSRHPMVVVDLLERDLDDLARPATSDLISNLADLRVLAEQPEWRFSRSFLPPPIGGQDPDSLARARYLEHARETLPNRTGQSKLQTALTILIMSRGTTPPDVIALVVDNFSEFPLDDQESLATTFWPQIRSPRLAPALISLLPKVDRSARPYVIRSLVDASPALAHDSIQAEVSDPSSFFGSAGSAQLMASYPDDAFRGAGPGLVAAIRTLAESAAGSNAYRLQAKASLLPRVAGPELAPEVRTIYDRFGDKFNSETKGYVLAYLARWDAEASGPTIELALRGAHAELPTLLDHITQVAYPPRIDAIVKEQLMGDDIEAAGIAAIILARRGRAEDRQLIESRLIRWQSELRARTANSQTADQHETPFVIAMANSKLWTLTAADRERLLSSCVTESCRQALSK